MQELDNQEKELYEAYILHRDNWINYITPKALQKLNTYLSTTGKLFNNNDYWNYYMSTNVSNNSSKPASKETTSRYKKLSLLFHPDKFPDKLHTGVDTFFSLLTKFHKENNLHMLEVIDSISHLILELPSLEILNKNLEHSITKETLEYIKDAESNNIFDLLNSSNLEEDIMGLGDKTKACIYSNYENFLNSICYKFYMNNPDTIQYVNETFLTETEMVTKIANCQEYEENFVIFCGERYADNRAILEAVVKWQMARNEKLKKENTEMKAKLKNQC